MYMFHFFCVIYFVCFVTSCVCFICYSSVLTHKHADEMTQAHTHTHTLRPPVCVGFLQTYLYGICILHTFIWLSGLGPRGAGVAWGSVSQTHTDGWAKGACATLYWVSYDYPALSHTHTHTHTYQNFLFIYHWNNIVELVVSNLTHNTKSNPVL